MFSIIIGACGVESGSDSVNVSGNRVDEETVTLSFTKSHTSANLDHATESVFKGDVQIELWFTGTDGNDASVTFHSPTKEKASVQMDVGEQYVYEGRKYNYVFTMIDGVYEQGLGTAYYSVSFNAEAYEN